VKRVFGIVGVVGMMLCSLAGAGIAGPAENAYRKGNLERARKLYEERLHEEPGDLRARYNLGNVLYRSEQLKAAEEAYQSTLGSPDPALRARAAHNLGNARLQEGEIDGAIAAYVDALRAEPGNPDTQYNLELALRMKEMKPPQQEQSQDQQQKQDQQGKQDRQKAGQQGQQQDKDKDKEKDSQAQEKQQPDGSRPQQDQPRQDQQEQQPGQSPPPAAPGDYSKEAAERVLDGLSQEERDLLADRWRTLGRNVRVEKDW
jgi:Ca-activated chloride channel homolog